MSKLAKRLFLLGLLFFLAAQTNAEATAIESIKGFTNSFKSGGGYLDVGVRTGYISGQNTYDLAHGISELEFPLRAYLGGGNLSLGYKDLSINAQAWGSLSDDPSSGMHMKDKDWTNGQTYSDTKAMADSNTVIWDANMRYNFLRYAVGQKKINQEDRAADNLKLGVLLGYRYERFGYKGHGLYQTSGNGEDAYSDRVLVTEYKIKYRLPYYGMALDVQNAKFGVLINAKYAFQPYAKDYDNHALRNPPLHFFSKYNKNGNVFLGDCTFLWKFYKGWVASLGADAALIRINGVTWEEYDLDPRADVSVDSKSFIYWMGLGYKF